MHNREYEVFLFAQSKYNQDENITRDKPNYNILKVSNLHFLKFRSSFIDSPSNLNTMYLGDS